MVVYNISISWALYVLYLFYLATRPHVGLSLSRARHLLTLCHVPIAHVQPIKKFLAVKLVRIQKEKCGFERARVEIGSHLCPTYRSCS